MPLISRTIDPKYLSRKSLFDENGRSLVKDYELEAIANNTLSNVLRQLSSLVLVANDIFEDLAKQLQDVYERSCKLKTTINKVEEKVVECDPRRVTVPESDICTFSLRTTHFKSSHPLSTGLFTTATRPHYLQKLYESAAPTPIHTIRQLDRFRRDGSRSSKFFVCTPVLSGRKKRYRKVDLEIETRKPMVVEDLRRWTSAEALGDMTVLPNNTSKIPPAETTFGDEIKDEIDHLLPSPEEQMKTMAMKFPSSIVAVDISGKPFDRMSGMRKSLMVMESSIEGGAPRRRTKRRHRGKRRNTIAGTSQKEIEQAIAGDTATETEGCEFEPLPPLRSRSTDLFKIPKTTFSPTDNLKNHFNTLKNWSRTKLKFINYRNSSIESCKPSFQGTDVVDDIGIYETVNSSSSSGNKQKREKDRKQSSSSSAMSVPISTSSMASNLVVKLRENSLQRRHWRKGSNKGQEEPAHSSSGNWSASSESGRTSIASETTAPPKSSTTTSNNSLNHHHQFFHNHHHHPPPSVQSRRRYLNTSTSSSVSEGTLTPDINDMQFHDFLDGETSSVYSCDTEGYYTSFHMDSGLKTLKEEEAGLSFSTLQLQDDATPSLTTTFNNTSSSGASTVKTNPQLTAENEYELFGRGSTSTTTSSAGTVCTTLLAGNTAHGSTRSLSQFAPAVPERKSSLERKDKKHANQIKEENEMRLVQDDASGKHDELEKTRVVALIHDSPSPDSGHNTSSSPAESESQKSHSPNEHLEFSESDLESCDRNERIRTKTAMTTCRIPSMCLITPPQSDDEVNLRFNNQVPYGVNGVPYETIVSQKVIMKNNQNLLNSKLLAQGSNGSGKPLQIQIPKVVDCKKDVADVYAYPDKSKKMVKSDTVKTVSTNGVLETNIDSVAEDGRDSLHLIVNRETGYASIKTEMKSTHRSPSPSGGLVIAKEREASSKPSQPALKPFLLPSNFMEKFRDVLNKQKKVERKPEEGDYVTIANFRKSPKPDFNLYSTGREETKSEYVSLNELPLSKAVAESNPLALSSEENSLERKKRQGARVTLDSEGKVIYSSDSLKRKKQHTTFIPGKYVRESPSPSPVADKRMSKTIRPVNSSGLIKTNSLDKEELENRGSVSSPQMEKLIIKAGPRSCDSPTTDTVRMPTTRIVASVSSRIRSDKGVRITLENGEVPRNRSESPASSDASSLERRKNGAERCVSPSSSSSSSLETKKSHADSNPEEEGIRNASRWISQHPAALDRQQQQQIIYSQSGFPRNHPMYWTLPARSVYLEENKKTAINSNEGKMPATSSSHHPGASKYHESSNDSGHRKEFTSSTPSKEPLRNSNSLSLAGNVSPILKENLFSSKSKMTAEEIFAAIHKSKKKLNIKDSDLENRSESPQSSSSLSPDGSEKSLPNKSRERSSWSPNTRDDFAPKANEARTRRSWIGTGTPINSFKKLLLQQGIKSSPRKESKISAVEQLKLSKFGSGGTGSEGNLTNHAGGGYHRQDARTPPRGMLYNRGKHQWRFASPRTDVLSSTIPEDCSEVEKAEGATVSGQVRDREGSGFRFARSVTVDRGNTCNGSEGPESRIQMEKPPRENKSLEITKKYLQQARRNFFNAPASSPNVVGVLSVTSPARKELNFRLGGAGAATIPNSLLSSYRNSQNDSNKSLENVCEKRTPIISLETAL